MHMDGCTLTLRYISLRARVLSLCVLMVNSSRFSGHNRTTFLAWTVSMGRQLLRAMEVQCRCLRSVLHDRQGAGREASSAISRTRSGQKGSDWDLGAPSIIGKATWLLGQKKVRLVSALQGKARQKQWSPAFIISFICAVPGTPPSNLSGTRVI
jgi:hypothetical protein